MAASILIFEFEDELIFPPKSESPQNPNYQNPVSFPTFVSSWFFE